MAVFVQRFPEKVHGRLFQGQLNKVFKKKVGYYNHRTAWQYNNETSTCVIKLLASYTNPIYLLIPIIAKLRSLYAHY